MLNGVIRVGSWSDRISVLIGKVRRALAVCIHTEKGWRTGPGGPCTEWGKHRITRALILDLASRAVEVNVSGKVAQSGVVMVD